MGNQQERSLVVVDLAWLGGMIDGEGNLSLHVREKSKRCKTVRLYPRLQITNGDPILIREVGRVWSNSFVPVYVCKRPSGCIGSMVQGMKRCQKALNVITPYLRGKRYQATLLLWFINSRLSRDGDHAPYTEDEVWCFKELRRLNYRNGNRNQKWDNWANGILRGHTPDSAILEQMKIWSTHDGNAVIT